MSINALRKKRSKWNLSAAGEVVIQGKRAKEERGEDELFLDQVLSRSYVTQGPSTTESDIKADTISSAQEALVKVAHASR